LLTAEEARNRTQSEAMTALGDTATRLQAELVSVQATSHRSCVALQQSLAQTQGDCDSMATQVVALIERSTRAEAMAASVEMHAMRMSETTEQVLRERAQAEAAVDRERIAAKMYEPAFSPRSLSGVISLIVCRVG
jgi:hypothetical protein